MGILLKLFLVICIVHFGSTFIEPYNQIRNQFQSLQNSIAKNDPKKNEISFKTLKQEVLREQQGFDTMREELQIAQNINAYKKRNSIEENKINKYIVASKREAKSENQVIMIKDKEHIVREFTLALDVKLVVVYYMQEGCGPCRQMAPIYSKFPQKYQNVTFLKVDIKKCSDIAESQNVRNVPTFIFYRSQKELHRWSGTIISKVEEKILQYLNSN